MNDDLLHAVRALLEKLPRCSHSNCSQPATTEWIHEDDDSYTALACPHHSSEFLLPEVHRFQGKEGQKAQALPWVQEANRLREMTRDDTDNPATAEAKMHD